MAVLKDVAKETGLSIRTISRVITGQGAVSEKTLKKVTEAAKRLGYRPNRAARSLKLKQSYEITVLMPTTDELFMQKISALESALRDKGYWVSLLMAESVGGNTAGQKLAAMVDEALNRMPAGIVMTQSSEKEISRIADSGVPYILIDSLHNYDAVNINRSQGVYDAVRHLHASGRSRIAYAGMGQPEDATNLTRLPGYVRAISELNLCPILLCDTEIPEQFECGRDLALHLDLTQPNHPQAIIAYSDYMAMGLLAGFYKRNVRVPEEIAVVGFDDRPAAARSAPPLTTVKQPNREVGLKAAEIILKKIEGAPAPDGGWSCSLPTTLVVREST